MNRLTSRFPSLSCSAAVALAMAAAGCHWPSSAERAGETIADKNAAARGGVKAWRRVHSLAMTGTLEAGKPRDPVQLAMTYSRSLAEMKVDAKKAFAHGATGAARDQVQLPFLMELKRPRRSRLEIRFQGQTAVQVFDGRNGWKLRPFLGRREVEPFSEEELRAASQQTDLDGPLIDHASKGYRVSLLGTDKVDGRDCYQLEVSSASGLVRHVWVDQATYLDVKVDGTRKMDGKVRPVFTYLRDYRAVDGLMVPHVLETTVAGVPGSERIRVEHVALNPELEDALFARPD